MESGMKRILREGEKEKVIKRNTEKKSVYIVREVEKGKESEWVEKTDR